MAIDLITGLILIVFFTGLVAVREYLKWRKTPDNKKTWITALVLILIILLFVVEIMHKMRWI